MAIPTILFPSPGFPPNAWRFCTALKARGARVVAMIIASLVFTASCGRIGFEPGGTDAPADAPADAPPDAPPDAPSRTIAQRAYVKASNTGAGDRFADNIALSADGSTLAIGAYLEDSGALGIDGDQSNNTAQDAGAVYVFRRTGLTWKQQAYVKASNTGAGDQFGYRIALSFDGSTLVVGALREDSGATGIGGDQADNTTPDAGAVYVFTRTGMTWTEEAYIKAFNTGAGDLFGVSVAISADSSTLAVGAFGEGSAAVGVGGDQNNNAAAESGAVYVFTRAGTTWSQQAYVKASNTGAGDQFGDNVALSFDGTTLVAMAPVEDSAATGIDGAQADNSATDAGAAYVFSRSGTTWTQQAYVKASNTGTGDQFGYKVAISSDGSTFAVGAAFEDSATMGIDGNQVDDAAMDAGAVYVFARTGATWTQQAYVKASNAASGEQFGAGGVALSGDGSTLGVGAYREDSAAVGIDGNQTDHSAADAGAAYLFTRTNTTWTQKAYIKASNTDAGDLFGGIAMSADASSLAVGAPVEASAAVGVGGNQADNSAASAGAAYVFE